jgi:hypothetical protein
LRGFQVAGLYQATRRHVLKFLAAQGSDVAVLVVSVSSRSNSLSQDMSANGPNFRGWKRIVTARRPFKLLRKLMNIQNTLSTSLLAAAALFGVGSQAWAQVPTGAVSQFAALGGTNVTCTGGSVVGGVGTSPGSAVPYTNTGCTIAGASPPGTNQAAAQGRADFLGAYAAFQAQSASCTLIAGSLAAKDLGPGVYCVDAVAKTGELTLTGPSDGVWIFLINGALTGTNFSVTLAGGGQPCNVFWVPSLAATLTTSSLKGNILAGDSTAGSVTLTGGTLAGQAAANVALTMTSVSVIGCPALGMSQ